MRKYNWCSTSIACTLIICRYQRYYMKSFDYTLLWFFSIDIPTRRPTSKAYPSQPALTWHYQCCCCYIMIQITGRKMLKNSILRDFFKAFRRRQRIKLLSTHLVGVLEYVLAKISPWLKQRWLLLWFFNIFLFNSHHRMLMLHVLSLLLSHNMVLQLYCTESKMFDRVETNKFWYI